MVVNTDVGARKIVTLPHSLIAAIRKFRFSNEIRTESEAIRQLIEAGLQAHGVPNNLERKQEL